MPRVTTTRGSKSREGDLYGVFWDVSLGGAFESDETDSWPSEGEFTTFGPFANPAPEWDEIYFRIVRNP